MPANSKVALLLEDETLIAMAVEMDLGESGFSISTVDTCKDAHLWLDANTPNVVIVDIQLKDGSSESFVERLVVARIPFLVHSGENPRNFTGTPFAKGEWVSKPSRMADLQTMLWTLTS